MISQFSRKFLNSKKAIYTSQFCFASKKDLYNVLGINKSNTQAEIKLAYYGLAQKYHPDKNSSPDAKEKFAEINNAYETLSDDSKRKIYDQSGLTGDQQAQGQGGGDPFANYEDFFRQGQQKNSGAGMGGFDETIFGDFASFFNMGEQGEKQQRGQDIYLNIEISFMDSVNGTSKTMNFEKKGVCSTCKGSKCQPGTAPGRCTNCGGRGTVSYRQGPMVIQMTCNRCKGAGVSIKNPCTTCRGAGISRQTINESVAIPKGIAAGQNLRLQGKGHVSDVGSNAGDLIIKISVKPDLYFKRDGFDIITDANISISQAVLGDNLDIRTLAGNKSVKVPSGSQDSDKIKLSGLGISKLPPQQNQQGDHIVNLKIQIPTKLTDNQRRLFEELSNLEKRIYTEDAQSKTEGGDQSKNEGVFDKFKEMFNKQ